MQPLRRPSLLPVPVEPPRRRDPAPSRIRYRLARLWLSPAVRALATFWLPIAAALGIGWLVLSHPGTYARIDGLIGALRERVFARPEFQLTGLAVIGGSDPLRAAVEEVVGLSFPLSSLALDLDAIRARVEALDAVENAEVSVASGSILALRLRERRPVAVHRTADGLALVDRTGKRVAALAARADRPDLALILGEGADDAVAEALSLQRAASPVAPRIRAFVRVGARRWDIVLDRDQRIMLPETGALLALERAMGLDRAEGLFERDVMALDLRDGARPVLRLGPEALRARAPRDPAAEDRT